MQKGSRPDAGSARKYPRSSHVRYQCPSIPDGSYVFGNSPRAIRERVYLRADADLTSGRRRGVRRCVGRCFAGRRNDDQVGAGPRPARPRCAAPPFFDRRSFGQRWSALQRRHEAAPWPGSARPSDPADHLVRERAWPRPATAALRPDSRRDHRGREPLHLRGCFRSGPSSLISARPHGR
jgi:hypothetical protein